MKQYKQRDSSVSDNYRQNDKNIISELSDGDYFNGTVKILRYAVPGPVILSVTDGTKIVDAVSKECEFKTDDVVDLKGPVTERGGRLQIEIKGIIKSDKDFDKILDEKSEPKSRETSIRSDRFEILKPYFFKIAKAIRRAIIDNRPILIRHHADADGIISGISIEHACRMFMEDFGINPEFNLYRSPSKAPFYEITDMFRDISFTNKMLTPKGHKKPLILVLDNGSTPEDVFAMKSLKMLGYDIIVIDHHNPVEIEGKKTSVCPYLKYHLNPYMEGLDGETSAGMLCYETARLIHEKFDMPVWPAVSAIGDRCSIPETEEYIKNSGISEEVIRKKVIAMDFTAYHLRFDPGKGIYEELFDNDEFVDMINTEVTKGVETQLQSTLPYLRTQDINGVIFSYIDLEKYTLRFTYPTPGKVIGMIHDEVAVGKESSPVITVGFLSDMVIIRATKPILPIAEMIKNLQKNLPEANVDGGGHECAGTIKFVSAHLHSVLENIKQQIRDLQSEGEKEAEQI